MEEINRRSPSAPAGVFFARAFSARSCQDDGLKMNG